MLRTAVMKTLSMATKNVICFWLLFCRRESIWASPGVGIIRWRTFLTAEGFFRRGIFLWHFFERGDFCWLGNMHWFWISFSYSIRIYRTKKAGGRFCPMAKHVIEAGVMAQSQQIRQQKMPSWRHNGTSKIDSLASFFGGGDSTNLGRFWWIPKFGVGIFRF